MTELMNGAETAQAEGSQAQATAEAPVAPATPATPATPAASVSVSVAVAEHANAKADLAALKAALAADAGAGRLSVLEAATAAPVAERADFVERQLNTDTMRDLLKALGHDIGDVWDDVVKLAKKAI